MDQENQTTPQKKPLPEKTQPTEPEISFETWLLMGGTAFFFDTTGALVNLIPIAGQILDIGNDLFADATFLMWFTIKGEKYSKTTVWGGIIVKFIPILNILPEYTLMIILMYFQAKAKKELAKVPGGQIASKAIQGKINANNVAEPDQKNDLRTNRPPPLPATNQRKPVQAINQPRKTITENERKERTENIRFMQESNLKNQHEDIIKRHGGQEKWDADVAESKRKWREHVDADKKVDDAYKQSKTNFGFDKAA